MNDVNQLLKEYASNGSELAFRELVTRYVDLVYSVALRRLKGDEHRAEEVTQTVFTDLAQKAATLPERVMLGGWLHRHTGFVAGNYVRGEIRRQVREKEAAIMMLHESEETNWQEVAPFLDEAIDQLDSTDREAVLLRYFEKRDLRSLGAYLGISEDAAQKRVSRAVDKLREMLSARGVAMTGALLGTLLTERAVMAAGPAGLAQAVSTQALKNLVPAGLSAVLGGLLSWGLFKGVAVVITAAFVIAVVQWQKVPPHDGHGALTVSKAGPSQLLEKKVEPVAAVTPVMAAPVAMENNMSAVETNFIRLKLVAATTGQPVTGVKIRMLGRNNQKYFSSNLVVDEEGVVNVPVVKAELTALMLTTQLDGFADTRLQWSLQRGDVLPESYTLRLVPAVPLGGLVVDADGRAVVGAKVYFTFNGNPLMQGKVEAYASDGISVMTDAEGRWKIRRIADSMIRESRVGVLHADHLSAYLGDMLQNNAEEELRKETHIFRMGRSLVVRGVVVDPAGQPVSGAKVWVGMWSEVSSRKGETGEDGRFEVAGCKPGKNLLTAKADGFAAVTEEVEIGEGAGPFRLLLQRGKPLILRVVDQKGQPVSKAYVGYDFIGSPSRTGVPQPIQTEFKSTTDDEGRVTWPEAPDRELGFNFQAAGYMWLREFKVRPDGREHVVTLLPAVEIEGTVKDADSGELLPRFRIITGSPEKDYTKVQPYIPVWSSLERMWLNFGGGKFKHTLEEPVIMGQANSGYLFRFEAEGYESYISGVVPANAGKVRMDVTLRRTSGHAVMVKLPDGRPAADMEVGVILPGTNLRLVPGGFGANSVKDYTTMLRTDRAGIFKMMVNEAIQRVVVANSSGYGDETMAALLNSPTLQIHPWGRVEGVYLSDGKPVANADLRLDFLRPGGVGLTLDNYETKTDAQGRFAFSKTPFGQMQLILQTPGPQINGMNFKSHLPLQRVEARPGETTFVNLGGNTYRLRGKVEWPAGYGVEKRGGVDLLLLVPGTPVDIGSHQTHHAGTTLLVAEASESWAGKELTPGHYTIVARSYVVIQQTPIKVAYVWASKEIDLPADNATMLDFGTLEMKIKEGQE